MGYKENKARFERTEIMALKIGLYANYRHKVLAFSFPDLFDRMCETHTLRGHLKDVQLAMDSYMKDYTNSLLYSPEYRKEADLAGYEKAYNSFVAPAIEKEEQRIGNRWVCAKDPYNDELFMEWLTAAKICGMLTEKNSPTIYKKCRGE